MAATGISADELRRRIVGFSMLVGTLLLWLASSLTIQWMSVGSEKYTKPIFVTLFNAAFSAVMLLPGMLNSTLNSTSLRPAMTLSITVGMLWTASAWVFNVSLLHTSVATNTVLSSTSSVFTFVFALIICKDEFRWGSFLSSLMCFVGCAIVASRSPANSAKEAVTNSDLGDALAVLATAMFALSSVLLRRFAPKDLDMTAYMGCTGLLALVASPVILAIAHFGGWETFSPPPPRALLALTLNAAFGSVFSNYLYNNALLLVSPLVANTTLSLSIPISAYTDQVILAQHRFSMSWYSGAAIVCAAVVLAAFDMPDTDGDDVNEFHSAKLEKAKDWAVVLGKGSAKKRRADDNDDDDVEDAELAPLVVKDRSD